MMRSLLVPICGLLAFTCPAQTSYTISGTVVSGTARKPVKRVLVRIASVGNTAVQSAAITGKDGRFAFTNLPAGKFALSAERHNVPAEFFHAHEGYSTAIVTGPGLSSTDIVFPLMTRCSISGTVNEEEGDPVRNAHVWLFRRGIAEGRLQTRVESVQQSDSSGGFRFGSLTPGVYLMAVQARPWYAQNGLGREPNPAAQDFDVAYPITYYGGSTDPNSGSAITLAEGVSTTVQIVLRAEPTVHLQITGAPAGANNGIAFVFAIGPDGNRIPADATFGSEGNRQEFTGIAPGRYIIAAPATTPGSGIGPRKTVDLSGSSSLDLSELSECSLSGRLSFEGERPKPDLAIVLVGDSGMAQARVEEDGSFRTADLTPGRYQVQLANAPGYYVKSVSIGGRALSREEIEIAEGSAVSVSVLAASGASTVDGLAIKNEYPFAGAMVLAVPADPARWSLIRRDQSDSDGTFSLLDVAPGRYTLIAVDDGSDLAYAEAGVLEPYLKNGKIVDVPLSRNSRLTVNVVGRQH